MNARSAAHWKSRILAESRDRQDILPAVTFALVVGGIVVAAIFAIFLPTGGHIGTLVVPLWVPLSVLFVYTVVNGGVGVVDALTILRHRSRPSTRYHAAALAVLDAQLAQGAVSKGSAGSMRDRIAFYLTPCDDPANATDCDSELDRLCTELAKLSEA